MGIVIWEGKKDNMKKSIISLLTALLLISGCSKPTEQAKSEETENKEPESVEIESIEVEEETEVKTEEGQMSGGF